MIAPFKILSEFSLQCIESQVLQGSSLQVTNSQSRWKILWPFSTNTVNIHTQKTGKFWRYHGSFCHGCAHVKQCTSTQELLVPRTECSRKGDTPIRSTGGRGGNQDHARTKRKVVPSGCAQLTGDKQRVGWDGFPSTCSGQPL